LVIATGAGAASRNSIGTGVFGGMLAATFLAIFFVPLFFVLIRSLRRGRTSQPPPPIQEDPDAPQKERDYQHA
jgi:HAE1 family hydrophobic/amphiphilic exporter-1/multidrug efflux pump